MSEKIIIKDKDAKDIKDSFENLLKDLDGENDEHKMIVIEFIIKEFLKSNGNS